MKKMTISVLAIVLGTISAQATDYTDSIGDDKWGNSHMDIISVKVTNDSAFLYFDIVLGNVASFAADPWARFGVGIDSVAGGSATADAWNDKIIMSSGMDFWGGGWTAETTNSAGINIYDATLAGWPEWENGGDGSTWVYYWGAEIASNSISFGVEMSTLGLSNGDTFNFDVYTFWNDVSAEDALGLSTPMPNNLQYDSGTNVLSYTVEGVAPVYGDPAQAFISLGVSNVVIEFLAESNVFYYVQSTSNLTQSWVNVSSLIIGDGTTKSTSYPVDSDEKFFQVIQP